LAKPYTPDHPSCNPDDPTTTTTTTTEPSGFGECVFDAETGVLDIFHGQREDADNRTCVWHVDNPDNTFEFQIKSDPNDPVAKVKLPHLIVNADIVFPTPKCFEASGRGFQDLPYPADFWTFSPASAGCGDDPYLLTISIQALKSGSVNLVMTQNP